MNPGLLLKYSGSLGWIGFFLLILASWLFLAGMTIQTPLATTSALDWLEHLTAVCSASPTSSGLTYLFPMWLLMSVAMMAPTFIPSLRTYHDLTHAGAGTLPGFVALVGGYLAVWLAYSLFAALLQYNLSTYLLSSEGTGPLALLVNAGLLLAAGAYQFSTIKESCLSQCRRPMIFYLEDWRPGIRGAFQMGLQQGVVCVGCCWALMMLAFIGGAMSLFWMGLATLLMTVEKLPELGKFITRPLGITLIFASAFFLGRVLALTYS